MRTPASADTGDMATPRRYPPAEDIDRAARIIRARLVNRTDRWGSHWEKDGRIRNCTAPSRAERANAERAGKRRRLGLGDLKRHIRQMFAVNKGMPLGVYSISTANTSKWIAWDIDNHGEGIPQEVPPAVRDAIFRHVQRELGLACVVVDSGGGGWHIWAPLAAPVDSAEAHLVSLRVRAVGAMAWPPEAGRPKIDAFPKAPVHNGPTQPKECGGGWLRLPGRHKRLRDHVSGVVGKRRFAGLEVWTCFDRVAAHNTLPKWRKALAVARLLPPAKGERAKSRGAGRAARAEFVAKPLAEPPAGMGNTRFDYDGWKVTRLVTQPLEAGERRLRERAIVERIVIDARRPLEVAEGAVRHLYAEASGESRDLACEEIRDELLRGIPMTVQRIVGAREYRWASRADADRARGLLVEEARRMEESRRRRHGLRADIAGHFALWLDGLYRLLRRRAERGGAYFLATTVLTCKPEPGAPRGPHDFHLRDHGGDTRIRMAPPAKAGGGRRWIEQDKHKVFTAILRRTPIDGRTRVRVVRPAVRSDKDNTQPLIIDASRLPIDRP